MDLPTTINTMASLWHVVLAQAPTVSDLAQELEVLKAQVESLQQTNQLLSDGLTTQIDFLNQENQDLTASFSKYIDAMKWQLTALVGLAAILSAFGGWIFKSNLDDAKKVAREMIERRVEGQISALVDARVEDVSRTLRREQVIGSTYVDYYLPDGTQTPPEFKLLKARKFGQVRLLHTLDSMQRPSSDVVVLDLVNYITPAGQRFSELPKPRPDAPQTINRETVAKPFLDQLLDILPSSTVIVVYVSFPPLQVVNNAPSNRYVIAANNPVTLVGNTSDGAYVAFGDRNATTP